MVLHYPTLKLPAWKCYLTLLCSVFLHSFVFAQTVTLNPTADTYLSKVSATTNYGSATTFSVEPENNNLKRAIMRFNVSSVPAGATIVSATLTLQKTAGD